MIERLRKEERGDILVIFAVMFTVLIMIIALSTDVAILYARRARIYEIGNVMRRTRFTKGQEFFMNSDKPGEEYAKTFSDYATKNGFNGKLTVTYDEYESTYEKRNFKINMEFEEKVETSVLKFIGIKEVPIKVVIKGAGHIDKSNIWKPQGEDWKKYTAIYENGKQINK
ncbi:TadE/TadG family type IV pilus assembly protein [Helcococcus ovis]|uniref:TadE/TadG family type IV pilus assembly protein n=1 Tax=Helcococcus ovis TaxID=72026 RepID=UPI0038BDA630